MRNIHTLPPAKNTRNIGNIIYRQKIDKQENTQTKQYEMKKIPKKPLR